MVEPIKYIHISEENYPIDSSYLGGKSADNYYTKDLTYSKDEINSIVGDIESLMEFCLSGEGVE